MDISLWLTFLQKAKGEMSKAKSLVGLALSIRSLPSCNTIKGIGNIKRPFLRYLWTWRESMMDFGQEMW